MDNFKCVNTSIFAGGVHSQTFDVCYSRFLIPHLEATEFCKGSSIHVNGPIFSFSRY